LKIRLIAAAAALLTSFCTFAGARANVYGSVRGTVTDDTGHPIASAQVVLADIHRNTNGVVLVSTNTSSINPITTACNAFCPAQRALLFKKSSWEVACK
jgi:hypothetical protein